MNNQIKFTKTNCRARETVKYKNSDQCKSISDMI